MVELLKQYSGIEIIAILVISGASLKSLISFYDWAIERLRKVFKKENQKETEKEKLEAKFKKYEDSLEEIKQEQNKINEVLESLSKNTELLIQSDKDDIKAWITKEHHYYCYQKKWIDDYSLDCIERRYKHYKDEGGNSFIKDLMEEIRNLPKKEQE